MEKKAMELSDFVYLMLATLANDSKIINLLDLNEKAVCLPANYKQIIANILCSSNEWKERFSTLIDTKEYFEDHFFWEFKLALTLKETLKDLDKTVNYNLENDYLSITFTQAEIDAIMNQYQDEDLKNIMQHFCNLLVDYIYTRQFQENLYDHSADTVRKMHDILKKQCAIKNGDETQEKKGKKFTLFRAVKLR